MRFARCIARLVGAFSSARSGRICLLGWACLAASSLTYGQTAWLSGWLFNAHYGYDVAYTLAVNPADVTFPVDGNVVCAANSSGTGCAHFSGPDAKTTALFSCGLPHYALYGITGYAEAYHWCADTAAQWAMKWFLDGGGRLVGYNPMGDLACFSLDATSCKPVNNLGDVSKLDFSKNHPLVCGTEHQAAGWAITGYDTVGHWCYNDIRKFPNPTLRGVIPQGCIQPITVDQGSTILQQTTGCSQGDGAQLIVSYTLNAGYWREDTSGAPASVSPPPELGLSSCPLAGFSCQYETVVDNSSNTTIVPINPGSSIDYAALVTNDYDGVTVAIALYRQLTATATGFYLPSPRQFRQQGEAGHPGDLYIDLQGTQFNGGFPVIYSLNSGGDSSAAFNTGAWTFWGTCYQSRCKRGLPFPQFTN